MSGFPFSSLFPAQITPQCCPADSQLPGGGGTVAVVGGHRLLNHLPDHLVQGPVRIHCGSRRYASSVTGPFLGQKLCHRAASYISRICHGSQRLKDMLELGIVVGPVILAQHFHGPGFEAGDLFSQFQLQAAEVETGQRGNFIRPAPQGRQMQRQTAQTADKILSGRPSPSRQTQEKIRRTLRESPVS